jgi:hypothetical protein
MRNDGTLGLEKRVRLEWLLHALNLAASGSHFSDVRDELEQLVSRDNPGTESRRKVIRVIKRLCFDPQEGNTGFYAAGLQLYRDHSDGAAPKAVVWGLCLSTYPFFWTVAEATGRLLRLQNTVTVPQVTRRLAEKFGDRAAVVRRARYHLSSFLQWGVLIAGIQKGSYSPGKPMSVSDVRTIAWLVESLIRSHRVDSIPISHTNQHPALFPFQLDPISAAAMTVNSRLKVIRHSLNEEMLAI